MSESLPVPALAAEPALPKPVWGAVLAGVVVVLAAHLLLSLLGIGVGAGVIDPLEERAPLAGVGTGAGVWLILQSMLAVLVGAGVAGRLAGRPTRSEGALHGVVTWATATLVGLVFVGSALGGFVEGGAGLASRGGSAAARAGSWARPVAEAALQARLSRSGIDWSAIRDDAERFLGDTRTSPGAGAGGGVSEEAFRNALQKAFADGTLDGNDRETLVSVIAARGSMARGDAEAVVTRWERNLEQLRSRGAEALRQSGDAAAHAVSKAAWIGFLALALGVLAAAVGGATGAVSLERTMARRRARSLPGVEGRAA